MDDEDSSPSLLFGCRRDEGAMTEVARKIGKESKIITDGVQNPTYESNPIKLLAAIPWFMCLTPQAVTNQSPPKLVSYPSSPRPSSQSCFLSSLLFPPSSLSLSPAFFSYRFTYLLTFVHPSLHLSILSISFHSIIFSKKQLSPSEDTIAMIDAMDILKSSTSGIAPIPTNEPIYEVATSVGKRTLWSVNSSPSEVARTVLMFHRAVFVIFTLTSIAFYVLAFRVPIVSTDLTPPT